MTHYYVNYHETDGILGVYPFRPSNTEACGIARASTLILFKLTLPQQAVHWAY
jgi:hypothetical protein